MATSAISPGFSLSTSASAGNSPIDVQGARERDVALQFGRQRAGQRRAGECS